MKTLFLALSLSLATTTALAAGSHDHQHHTTAAIGEPGQGKPISRTVAVVMSDNMRFEPAQIKVKAGETIRFAVKNIGKLQHEFTLGSQSDLLQHYEMMKKFPNMQHEEPNTLSLAGGTEGELLWHFNQSGEVHFACLFPSHFQAGMKGKIHVQR